jgi:hypothetical protein
MNLKKILLTLAVGTISVCAYAQGTINLLGGGSGPTNSGGVFQVGMNVGYYFSGDTAALVNPGPVADGLTKFFQGVVNAPPTPYLNDGTHSVGAGHLGGDTVIVQVRAWSGAFASFEAAYQAGIANPSILVGVSKVMTLKLGGADINGNPFPTPNLIVNGQLKSWLVAPVVPEPSTIALALLGGALLLFRRRSVAK